MKRATASISQTKPIEVSISYQPIEVSISYQPIEASISYQPIEASISYQPIEVDISYQPIEVSVSYQLYSNTHYDDTYDVRISFVISNLYACLMFVLFSLL